jgi:hypothetical protein
VKVGRKKAGSEVVVVVAGSQRQNVLRCGRNAGNVSGLMNSLLATADILTSARMAAGMTSRARRPMNVNLAG